MARTETQDRTKAQAPPQQPPREAPNRGSLTVLPAPRLPYPEAAQEMGIDEMRWRSLVEARFPNATNPGSVLLAVDYCRARNLDVMKAMVHIVPVWSTASRKMIDTIWPGIAEVRATASRTGEWAGIDEAEWGPDIKVGLQGVEYTVPEWCRYTVYRLIKGEPRKFVGPKVYWLETYARAGRATDEPNEMWKRRKRGQIDKCAEAGAIRRAFSEEFGDGTAEEMWGQVIDGSADEPVPEEEPAKPAKPRQAKKANGDAKVHEHPADAVTEVKDEPEETFPIVDPAGEMMMEVGPLEWPGEALSALQDFRDAQNMKAFFENNMDTLKDVAKVVGPNLDLDQLRNEYALVQKLQGKGEAKPEPEHVADQPAKPEEPQAQPANDQTPAKLKPHTGRKPAAQTAANDETSAWFVPVPVVEGVASLMHWFGRANAKLAECASHANFAEFRRANAGTLHEASAKKALVTAHKTIMGRIDQGERA